MPRFLTISPTHVSGKKKYAWNNFLSGRYISIGWLRDVDLTGKSIDEVISIIKSRKYSNEKSAIDSFKKFLSLEEGDYVAVNNANHGLFGVGIVTSSYRYQKYKHHTGTDNQEKFYSHFREVEWIYTNYVKREDIINPGETSWQPFGTVGTLLEEVPPYVKRLLGDEPRKVVTTEIKEYPIRGSRTDAAMRRHKHSNPYYKGLLDVKNLYIILF